MVEPHVTPREPARGGPDGAPGGAPGARGRRRRAFLAAAVAGMTAAALTGCTGAPSAPGTGPGSDTQTAQTTVTAVPRTAAEVRADGVPVGVGGLTMHLVWPEATPSAAGSGVRTLGWQVASAAVSGISEPARLVGPEGSTVEVLDDGSAVVRDAGGRVLAAADRPVTTAGYGRWIPDGDEVLVLHLEGPDVSAHAPAATPAPDDAMSLTATVGDRALASATWGEREGGRSLAVEPTDWVRHGSEAATELLWSQVVAEHPEAGSSSMHDQLVCHALGAPDKATWNLEPWRPDVGLLAVLTAACNPT